MPYVIITSVAIVSVITLAVIWFTEKHKRKKIRLECEFMMSEPSDSMLDIFKEDTGVSVDGILGNDFMVKYGYVIDFDNMLVKHKSRSISIKDSMDILEIPMIVLYQGMRKYIFILDTGAQRSILHSKYSFDGMRFSKTISSNESACGVSGEFNISMKVFADLYYSTKRQEVEESK